ncbi:hypothetical protein GSY74_10230 [Sulfurovum sp. bin170]|uniref:hypothetical protein n=1 Tax=Sulfurovum sp. bin170 TaxID=2695268 RepID=UPI0013DFCEC1|nr:hypothetical protein [Sulfurovum sp. bin170]NEW61662.1 hypothetical protein [Sulfurovum sp. bin170]
MKNILQLLLTTMLFLSLFNGCASKQNHESTPKGFDSARTIRTTNSSNVVCHNCRAKFKLSHRIQKLVGEGNAEVACPVCHKNYLTGAVVKH